ncbi:uncharacterized protein LOC124448303 [Xenia sp. Carnegie-2017]|uniref:uncharacterized protein LOC124448303 n=1 Tax=Xenia sp. Carnegie-2017 TaxID=2897299 RepID=UPI001F04B674|nr:uncharacterized protein LOC124448303 [Xenia sp. Carnegie-2017]
MECDRCHDKKLSNEFPFFPLTKNCDHALLHCLECAIECVQKHHMCSQCEIQVKKDNNVYREYLETLEYLYPNEGEEEIIEEKVENGQDSGNIFVTTMSGELLTLSYHRNKRIIDLKKEVQVGLKTEPEKQRLLYQNNELKVRTSDHGVMTLKDYNIPPNSTVHLIIVLCAVPDDLEEVVFNFCWSIPPHQRRDFLDVSVFAYNGVGKTLGYICYRQCILRRVPGIMHSGPARIRNRVGHQNVNVNLKIIPDHVDKLVFTLSACRSSSISQYPYYRLQFYDVNFPDRQLIDAKVDVQLKDHKSIIMCCLSRKNGRWEVIEVKEGSDGFAYDYDPLKATIKTLIRQGFF